jgi:hypothetical protein
LKKLVRLEFIMNISKTFERKLVLAALCLLLPLHILAQGVFNTGFWQLSYQLAFQTAAQTTLPAGNCSTITSIQTRTLAGVATNVPAGIIITLASTGTVTFYSDPGCTASISTIAIPSGSSLASFYFIDSAIESPVITATSPPYATATQTETVLTNPYVWTGAVSSAWNLAGNWAGASIPGPSATALFDNSCSARCSPVIAADINIKGLRAATTYTGTVDMLTYNMSIGLSGFSWNGGTFTGASDNTKTLSITNAPTSISAGTFTAPAGFLAAHGIWSVTGSPTVTFPAGSEFDLTCTNPAWSTCYSQTVSINLGTVTYKNVVLRGFKSNWNLNGGTWTVNGNFSFGDINGNTYQLQNTTVNVSGNITQTDFGYRGVLATIVATGTSSGQTITGLGGVAVYPPLRIDTASNPVTLSGTINTTGYTLTTSGTFSAAGSTLAFECLNAGFAECYQVTSTVTPGVVAYGNVIFHGTRSTWDLGGGTMTVGGNLTVGDTSAQWGLNNGTINVTGNITQDGVGNTGTVNIAATGTSGGQLITGGNNYLPSLEIKAASNPITLTGVLIFSGLYKYTSSGTFNAGTSTVEMKCASSGTTTCYLQSFSSPLGAVTYYNLIFNGYKTSYDLGGLSTNVAGNLALGDLTSGYPISNGTLNVYGNVTQTNTGYTGSAVINVAGTSAGQTITGISNAAFFPAVTINAASNPVTLSGYIRLHGEPYTYTSSGSFTTSGSTLELSCPATATTFCFGPTENLSLGSVAYNNLSLHGYHTTFDLGGSTANVAGTLALGDGTNGYQLNNGVINAYGNITQDNLGYIGTASIVAAGTSSGQTITGTGNAGFPSLIISAVSNPITLSGTVLTPNWIYNSSGTFTTAGSSLNVSCTTTANATCYNTSSVIKPGNVSYNYVTVAGYRTNWDLNGQTFNAASLTIGDIGTTGKTISNGAFNDTGNYSITLSGNSGSVTTTLSGNANRNLAVKAGASVPQGDFTINMASGTTVTQLNTLSLSSAGQKMNVVSGTYLENGLALTINNALTISAGAVLTKGGGTLTYGSLSNSGTLNP